MQTAKLFTNGASQAVRIPKEFRFNNTSEVYIKKVGDTLILSPKNERVWDEWENSLKNLPADFKASLCRSGNEPPQEREVIFE